MRTAVPDGYTCPNCGAPVTTEICEFCGAPTAVASKNADMKYPAIECIEADMDSKLVFQGFYMGIIFLVFGIGLPAIFIRSADVSSSAGGMLSSVFVAIVFGILGMLMLVTSIKHAYKYILTNLFGKRIRGYVWGYMDNKRNDGILHGEIGDRSYGQIMKILVSTEDGPIFLLYELLHDEQPYGIRQTVELKQFGNLYLLLGLTEKGRRLRSSSLG